MELWSHGNTRERSWSRVYLFPCLVRFPSKNTLLVEKLKDFSENRISKVTKNGVEKYFSKSEERSEWKNWNMGFLSPVYLYTWPPSVYEKSTKKRRLRGRDERGHMSRGRKKRVRTVSSRFYFASCPFLLGISGTTRKWREHEFHRFLTYSALLRLFPRRRYEVKNNIISLSERDPRSCTLVVSRFE